METKIYNLIILDESGSMDPTRKETISGCNEIINTVRAAQKKYVGSQQHFLSIYAFQSGGNPSRYLFENADPAQVAPITERDYEPCGCTPLYDAIGVTVGRLAKLVEQTPLSVGAVTIITDGMENSSREYTHSQVAALIDRLKAKGWNFNFIGANIDVEAVSRSLNIDNAMAFEQSCDGTEAMFQKENSCRGRWFERVSKVMRNAPSGQPCSEESFNSAMRSTSEDYFKDEDK